MWPLWTAVGMKDAYSLPGALLNSSGHWGEWIRGNIRLAIIGNAPNFMNYIFIILMWIAQSSLRDLKHKLMAKSRH